MKPTTCPECGTQLKNSQTCLDHFHMMGFWELDHQLYDVHHLMVLSYHLQHPITLSQEWIEGAKKQLIDFLEHGVTPQDMRKRIASDVDSGTRDYKIRATPDSTAQYTNPITWSMTAQDVVEAGMDQYYTSVEQWARSILKDLRQSENL